MSPRKAIIGLLALLPLLGGVPSAFAQTIDLISPDTSGLVWSGANDIAWTTSTFGWTTGDTVKLEWTTSGIAYIQFAKKLPYTLHSFRWYTTTLRNGDYKVRIAKSDAPLVFDESASFFQLTNPVIGKAYFVNDTDLTNDIYCSAIGSNFNNGTSPSTPKWNLQSVIDTYTLGPGDVVYVDTGRWRLPHNISIGIGDQGSASGKLSFAG
ncbi:MAG: hypothetical protein NTV79_01565, partial [Candidatus Aureabacteria bacterium]|nr:hypothetical protein [Candidatus Auribacterota bacterium]